MNNMKIIAQVLVGASVLALSACKEKPKSADIITTKPVVEVRKSTQKMGDYDMSTDVAWVGSTYQVLVRRYADEALPLADDGQGNTYYDNRIALKILRKDGSEFFARTFSKSDFAGFVDASYQKHSALLGIVFDRAEEGCLVFAASVGSPDKLSDEYVPLVVKVSRFGDVSISRDTQLDTASEGGAGASGDSQGAASDADDTYEEEDGV